MLKNAKGKDYRNVADNIGINVAYRLSQAAAYRARIASQAAVDLTGNNPPNPAYEIALSKLKSLRMPPPTGPKSVRLVSSLIGIRILTPSGRSSPAIN